MVSKMRIVTVLGTALAVAGLIVACAAIPVSPITLPAGVEKAVQEALEEQAGIAPRDAVIISAEARTWNDSSLGCPEPGKFYAQALVEGYKIAVRVGDEMYEVHTGNGRAVICDAEGKPMNLSVMSNEAAGVSIVVTKAKEHLAMRLDIDANEIDLIKVESRLWRNSGLGCEQPGSNYAQVIVPGQVILLQAGNDIYEYHAGEGRVIPCDKPTTQ